MEQKEALELLATKNSQGLISDDLLVKACESYQAKTGFDAYDIVKAILVGQQKVVDGLTYVWKLTPNAQQPFGWRLLTPNKSKKVKQELDGNYFPTDLKNLTFIKQLGGSTGAKLVEDTTTGKQYVMKRGANVAHVEEEYLTNQLYNIFGVKTPDFELYHKGTKDATLLSLYMENTEDVLNTGNLDLKHKEKIVSSFVVDALLANWDVYKNDNILLNKDNDTLFRVDNGGGLRFSAQGRDKADNFADTVDELDSMLGHNAFMTDQLTTKDIKKQIKEVLKKKDIALKFIEENSDADLLHKMRNRFFDLEQRLGDAKVGDTIDDANRELTVEEIEAFYKNAGDSLHKNDANGSLFMQEICNFRGFSHTPTVLEDEAFGDILRDDPKAMFIQRGIAQFGGQKATDLMEQFINGDCFYGGVNGAMYGIGIYGTLNDKKNYKNPAGKAYDIAYEYARFEKNHVMDIVFDKDAKIIDADLLDEMMRAEFFGPEFKEKQKEYMDALKVMSDLEDQVNNVNKIIEKEVKDDKNWSEDLLSLVNAKHSEIYAAPIEIPEDIQADNDEAEMYVNKENQGRWDNMIHNYQTELAKIPGAEFKKISNTLYEVKMPHKNTVYKLNRHVTERSNKQKNNSYKPYNWHIQMFEEFVVDNHYKVINDMVKKEISTSDKITNIVKAHNDQQKIVNDLTNEIRQTKSTGGNDNLNKILAEIVQHPGGEYRGFYAAIKGYDAIREKHSWGSVPFMIMLNRSKMKVRKFKKAV